ncbi:MULTISPECIES: ribonuclease activity regulator RraA [unclassified Streptomyces]|uniref:RraA family protein n=1 Tax=unclassified Streptomyces TaxID=2593676 RepID=UPI0025555C21|nr:MULTISPECIES: ribonuclease activity regulator RraA [unclassified Streptomyces]WRZ69217.1 ribonuclease activity regulator RraA [Streptomyces sp. NBC_01257]WSU63164.1 ribonuclease activity regulator RraA [Streptomyces sp. NBC_01104]
MHPMEEQTAAPTGETRTNGTEGTGAYASMRSPVHTSSYVRPTAQMVDALKDVSAATACAKLHQMGITRTFIDGPVPLHREPDVKITGGAVTLQFLPQREDVFNGAEQEDIESKTPLWGVLESIQPGDILVVAAHGSHFTGCLGDMLVRYFKLRGGAGIVVDGRVRDAARVRALGVPIWCTGVTPHYASQTELFPSAFNVPVGVGGSLVTPGDLIVADEDGAVVVPQQNAIPLAEDSLLHQDREAFARQRLDEGGLLSDYYPLTDRGLTEYLASRAAT